MIRYNLNKRILLTEILLLSLLFVSGCEDVISLDLDNVEPIVVIEGAITDEPGPTKILISKSADYNNSGGYEKISNAVVTISDELGNSMILEEEESGTYSTDDIEIVYGRKYNLNANIDDKLYLAETYLEEPLILDSTRLEFEKEFGEMVYKLYYYFQDIPNVRNYGIIKYAINGNYQEEYIVYQDRLSDGNYFGRYFDLAEDDLNVGDTLLIELKTINAEAFEFYETLVNVIASGDGNSAFSVSAPANPKSNISNNALGFFGGYSISRKTIVVE